MQWWYNDNTMIRQCECGKQRLNDLWEKMPPLKYLNPCNVVALTITLASHLFLRFFNSANRYSHWSRWRKTQPYKHSRLSQISVFWDYHLSLLQIFYVSIDNTCSSLKQKSTCVLLKTWCVDQRYTWWPTYKCLLQGQWSCCVSLRYKWLIYTFIREGDNRLWRYAGYSFIAEQTCGYIYHWITTTMGWFEAEPTYNLFQPLPGV